MKWIYIILIFVPVRSHYANFTKTAENIISSPCTDQNHYFLAPGVLTAGGTNRACLSRFYPEGSARMQLTLAVEDKQTYTASRELPPGDGGCLDISVPSLPNTKADLNVNVWYKEAKCVWERRVSVRIASGRVVVVHTERARYRPGDVVKARVFALKADLTPALGNIEEIWLEGPPGAWEGTRVAEWVKVRSKLGLAQVQHEIDELAPTGRWTVRARLADGSQGSATFWVGNYELPPFQLTVRHSPKVLRSSERLSWTVCVRYPWSEAVEGMLVIRLRSLGGDKSSSGVRTVARVSGRACHRHAAAQARLGLTTADIVVADFSFQEEGTRIWQNTTVVSQVVDKPISLEFITKPSTVISPGLPYKLKVTTTRWDDKPATNVRVIVCRTAADDKCCVAGYSDVTGVARLMFAATDDAKPQYTFQAHLSNDTTTISPVLTLSTRNSTIQAALGPLKADPHSRTFVPLYLSLQNVTKPVTVHFVVITRGGIIYRWGATTQCPIANSATYIQTATRNTKCDDSMPQYDKDNNINDNEQRNDKINANSNENNKNIDGNIYGRSYNTKTNLYNDNKQNEVNKISDYIIRNMNEFDINSYLHKNAHDKINFDKNETIFDRYSSVVVRNHLNDKTNDVNSVQYDANESDSLLDRHLLRVMLPIKVTQQMCPDSHLIAYFNYNGEFVSASKHFEMDDCFVNKVEATFQPRQTLPGSTATLQLSTPGPALCALTAIDIAAKWGTSNVKDVLMKGLRRVIDGHRNMTEFDTAVCTDKPQTLNNKEMTASWLSAAGVVTGDNVPRSCDSPALMVDDRTLPRTDFSEAWLWRLIGVGSDGITSVMASTPDSITRYEASAVCLSKTGIAISQPAVLQVFRDFFIHADCPKRLRRGDSTILRYRIFNYLYEPLSVQIQILTSPHIEGGESVESICIPPRSPLARRIPLKAVMKGEGRVGVRARVLTDGGCGNNTARRGVTDEVSMKIIVEPEGIPVEEHKSILLCGQDEPNSKSEVKWKWSQSTAVPGTEALNVWFSGNILRPLLADSDALVQYPRGCGEQNMARLATNLLALQHLDKHCSAAGIARLHVARGYTRQLEYIHPLGGFSAFGASDATPSTWLTAFSLKYMKKAHQILWPEQPLPRSIEDAEKWLRDQQMENGCFRNEGQVFHRELRGGINEEGELASISLTAYVITSLLDSPTSLTSPHISPLSPQYITNSISCLRALPAMKRNSPVRVYAHALRAYAFMKLDMYEEQLRSSNEANLNTQAMKGSLLKANEGLLQVMELIKMATTRDDYMYWDTSSLSSSIEATSYALLAMHCSAPVVRQWGLPALRWINSHRNPTGGFVSTQDTLVALEALSAWTSLQPTSSNLNITINAGSITKTSTISLADHIPEVMILGNSDTLDVNVEGKGCALIQATRRYNTLSALNKQGPPTGPLGGLGVTVTLHPDGTFDCDNVTDTCYCATVVEVCAIWSKSFPEMALLEVSLPGGYIADAKLLYSQLSTGDTLLRRIELPPSATRATLYLGEASTGPPAGPRGHSCYNIHAVGPQAATLPAHVKIFDYYNPDSGDTQFYTIPEECPSRITHNSTQDSILDNIFTKARSLSDDGEIIINEEYSFEDIPEGIPLEDPLYENLREKEDLKENTQDNHNVGRNVNKSTINNDYKEIADSKISKDNTNNNKNDVIKTLIQEVNRKITNVHKTRVDDKLDFSANSIKSHRSEKILNSENEEINKENVEINDKNITNLHTHEEIKDDSNKENIKIQIPTVKPEIIDISHKQDEIKVENPNLSNFHVIDSEKDLEVPSGIEGPATEFVLPPKDFIQNYKENIDKTKNEYAQNVGPTDNFGTSQRMPQNFESTQNFEPIQNFRPTQNFPPINNFGHTQNFGNQNYRPIIHSGPNQQGPSQSQNFRPTENTRRTQNLVAPRNFVQPNFWNQNRPENIRPSLNKGEYYRPLENYGTNLQPIPNAPFEYSSDEFYKTFNPRHFRNY